MTLQHCKKMIEFLPYDFTVTVNVIESSCGMNACNLEKILEELVLLLLLRRIWIILFFSHSLRRFSKLCHINFEFLVMFLLWVSFIKISIEISFGTVMQVFEVFIASDCLVSIASFGIENDNKIKENLQWSKAIVHIQSRVSFRIFSVCYHPGFNSTK